MPREVLYRDFPGGPIRIVFFYELLHWNMCALCGMLSAEMYNDERGHVFCRVCVDANSQRKCIFCKHENRDVQLSDLNEATELVLSTQELTVFCPNKKLGCTKYCPLNDMKQHWVECPITPNTKCKACDTMLTIRDLRDHEARCLETFVQCHICYQGMSRRTYQDHDQECLEKRVVCDDCKGEVLRKEKSRHASECPMRAVCCENCGGFYAYSSEKEHREQCEIKKPACEYCKLDLKGDVEKAIDTISELQQKIKDMERCNMSQQEEAKNKEAKLVKKIQELENRQMSKQEETRNENAKLVKRIQELENRQLEADQYHINLEDDVKVYRTVLQNLEDKVGRISKEAVTRRRVEMLNERVETYLGPMERLLNGLRDVDNE